MWSSRRGELVCIEVDEIAAAVAAKYPWTAIFPDERAAYARAVVDEQSIRDYLDSVGHLDESREERPAVRTLARFAARADRCRNVLGINPASHARILEKLSEVVRRHPEPSDQVDASLDALLAQGRAALLRGSELRERSEDPQGANSGQIGSRRR